MSDQLSQLSHNAYCRFLTVCSNRIFGWCASKIQMNVSEAQPWGRQKILAPLSGRNFTTPYSQAHRAAILGSAPHPSNLTQP